MSFILFSLWATATLLQLIGSFRSLIKFDTTTKLLPRRRPITILKPLKGEDPFLLENLRSFFKLRMIQDDEIIFCVMNCYDRAFSHVAFLMKRYPRVNAHLICDPYRLSINPKIQNIFNPYTHDAMNDLILISDSNVSVDENYLDVLDSEFDDDTGVLTAVVVGENSRSFGGYLDEVFLNTFYTRWLLLTDLIGHQCVVGKSMMFRKSVIEKFGGLKTLQSYLAEDYMTGVFVKMIGFKVKFMSEPIRQQIGKNSFGEFWVRHIRWGRIRRFNAPWMFAVEPLGYLLPSALIGAIDLSQKDPSFMKWFLLLHFFTWFMCDIVMIKSMHMKVSLWTCLAWAVREITALPMWLHVLAGNTIRWRGGRYKIHYGGRITK